MPLGFFFKMLSMKRIITEIKLILFSFSLLFRIDCNKYFVLLFFVFLFSTLLQGNNSDNLNSFYSVSAKIEQYSFSQQTKARNLIDSIKNGSRNFPDSISILAQCVYWEALVNYGQEEKDSMLVTRVMKLKQLLEKQKSKYSFEKGILEYALASDYYLNADYGQSYVTGLSALEHFKQIKAGRLIAKSLNLQGNNCSMIENYKMAEDYYRQALMFVDNAQQNDEILLNIYSVWGLTGKLKASVDSMRSLVPSFVNRKDTMILMRCYSNMGAYYSQIGDFGQSEDCYNAILDLIPTISNKRILFGLYQNIGVYYMRTNDLNNAKKYVDLAKNISIQSVSSEKLAYSYNALSSIFERQGKVDSAFIYLKLYNLLNTKEGNNAKLSEVYQAYVNICMESIQTELVLAEKQLQLKNRMLIIIGIIVIVILLLATLFLLMIQQKKRIREIENKELTDRLQSKQQIEQLQGERLEFQAREITSHALMLSAKNDVLQQINTVIRHSTGKYEEFREIERVIKHNLDAEETWTNFMLHFEQVHPGFFNKLNALNRNLTKNDIRLCAYLRIGISPKQIAQLLNISQNSVFVHRYRIRKKLDMSENEDLDQFICNI